MKMLSFTHPHVSPNLYNVILLWNTKYILKKVLQRQWMMTEDVKPQKGCTFMYHISSQYDLCTVMNGLNEIEVIFYLKSWQSDWFESDSQTNLNDSFTNLMQFSSSAQGLNLLGSSHNRFASHYSFDELITCYFNLSLSQTYRMAEELNIMYYRLH